MNKLSVIILAKNVENEIVPTLKTVAFADEILVVDTGSTDKTKEISKKNGAKIVNATGNSFAKWRNDGAEIAKGDWLLYVDSDERIPLKLAQEIRKAINSDSFSAFTISRFEVLLGKHLSHWPDTRVLRLIKKSSLSKWTGALHEQPQIEGLIGHLNHQLIHLTHKNIDEKLPNTLNWSRSEALLLFKANHPPMVWWRFIRIMFSEFWQRAFVQGLWKDGTEGWIEIIYQTFSRFVTYERLWEMQQRPSLMEKYNQIDKNILNEWKENK